MDNSVETLFVAYKKFHSDTELVAKRSFEIVTRRVYKNDGSYRKFEVTYQNTDRKRCVPSFPRSLGPPPPAPSRT